MWAYFVIKKYFYFCCLCNHITLPEQIAFLGLRAVSQTHCFIKNYSDQYEILFNKFYTLIIIIYSWTLNYFLIRRTILPCHLDSSTFLMVWDLETLNIRALNRIFKEKYVLQHIKKCFSPHKFQVHSKFNMPLHLLLSGLTYYNTMISISK